MFEFMQDHNMAQSVELAKFVQRRTCAAANRQNKGVKQAGFLVLRETSMPSCLIELGFISTPDEERFLSSSIGVSQLGYGIYQAFVDYKRKYDTQVSVPYKAEPQPKEDVQIPAVVPEPVKQEVKQETKKESRKERKRRMEEEAKKAAEEEAKKAAEEEARKKAEETVDTVAVEKPAVVEQPVAAPAPSAPVFKVQILASGSKLAPSSPQFKGVTGVDSYQEGGMYKFTVGASTNYNEIYQLRKSLLEKFPQAFIIAFKDGQKTDVRQAIEEFKKRKK
jgi:N-acetylmuramoyl-L-alanine amidase